MGVLDTFRNGGAARQWIRENIGQSTRQNARNVWSGGAGQKAAGAAGLAAGAFNLLSPIDVPELGVSEMAGAKKVYDANGIAIRGNSPTNQPTNQNTNPANDPNPGNDPAKWDPGTGGTGGGSGSGTSQGIPSQKIIADIGKIRGSYIEALDKQLGGLSDFATNLEGQINSIFESNNADLDNSNTIAINQLNQSRNDVSEQQAKSLKDLTGTIKNLLEAGNTKIGAAGAGSSSAVPMYSYAITKMGTQNRTDIINQASKLYNDINLKAQEVTSTYNAEKRKLNAWKGGELLKIAQEVKAKKEEIEMAKANADASTLEDIVAYESQFGADVVNRLKTLDSKVSSFNSNIDDWYKGWSSTLKNSASTLVQKVEPISINSNINSQELNPTVETNPNAAGSGMIVPWWNQKDKNEFAVA